VLKLTTKHIDQIRSYFLAETREEGNALQKTITPYFLSGFLIELKELFINHPFDEDRLRSIGKSMGATEHLNSLKEIQKEYYEHLASLYVNGGINEDIGKLLESNNQVFNEAIEYHANISNAFRIHERERLKKKFQLIEGQSEIHDLEITDAFRQIERHKLKSIFKNYDLEEKAPAAALVPNDSTTTIGSKNRNSWRAIAVAASIVGVIALAGYFFIQREEKIENSRIAKNKELETVLFGNPNSLTENRRIYEVKNNKLLGFNGNENRETVLVVIRNLNSKEELIQFSKSILLYESEKLNNKEDSVILRYKLDSLNTLQKYLSGITNTYTFDAERKSLILNLPGLDSVSGVFKDTIESDGKSIYIKLNDLYYKIKPSKLPLKLEPVDNKEVIKALQKK